MHKAHSCLGVSKLKYRNISAMPKIPLKALCKFIGSFYIVNYLVNN